MRLNVRKTIALTVLAGLLGASAVSPAAADGWGWHGGYGGPGWGYRGGWGHHGGWNNGGAVAAAAIGGLALGVAAGAMSQPRYGSYGGYYGDCYPVDRPVMDGWGNVVGYRRAQVCD
ncbi:hypothetical protein OGR47_12605 [Methylocystis sp. MJC1]|jgi:hypothetical protein|uniref:hypothetical protein n=1 Tax=Methylocystis sp. MJC1 TaxID=2654282 RepID=UPI0013EBBA22|nr:hypothetical protein [Methylocystis sp. MJC1]KAF2990928.1 hypothetical protein MJC1_02026 [Methylocystis sp. MJC1]MBU6527822.1 hypothetical protein [Methylocystis sp. MJC1]UZX10748.1 hypothetical protein OGR47_12605 [Methylocystis sp. MJC1]